ncbi:hypothetical protein FVEN_g8204 [Fusarium venenatum]|uniref:Uncharacterized protein n=1 Tax=Fusarium venenatum TaxID=56646 RepID=A0A2L2T4V6_9HYPO|nr:uncharacterized protein FVRRES_04427 [Fusarium venenatum]KAG8353936.1 hypothetical protein FVEN_g8204 [Fusarium venenatum]CEI59991.1 unnamed protein product [Fusarium venenatum]
MAKHNILAWVKYYGKYTHVKVKRFCMYSLVYVCLPCTCGMSVMWTDNAPWWDLPKKPGEDANSVSQQRAQEAAGLLVDQADQNT